MLYGAESLDKRAHFDRLLRKLDFDDDEDEAGTTSRQRQDVPEPSYSHHSDEAEEIHEEDEGEANERGLEPLSLLRTIFPPLFNPLSRPSRDGSMSVNSSFYMPWPPSSRVSGDGEPSSDEDLLPETLDEKVLVDELLEERLLEKWDRHRDIEGERALWARVNAKDPHPNLAADTVDSDLEDFVVDNEQPETAVIPEQPRRKSKRKRKEADIEPSAKAGTSRSKDEEGAHTVERSGETIADAPMDVEEREIVAPKRRRVASKKGLSQKALSYMQPGTNSRIKSSVYVLDSD